MNIHIGFVAYALDVTELVESLIGPDTTFHCHLHSHEPAAETSCYNLARKYGAQFRLHDHGINRGLARSWNDCLVDMQAAGAEVMMIANDDIVANRADMLRIAQGAVEHPECYMINGQGWHTTVDVHSGLQLALAAIQPIALETIGYFDEGFFPIYREDVDYYYRIALSGLRPFTVGETAITHQGERTIQVNERAYRQVLVAATRNEQYYIKKWGGLEGQELFTHPFNDARLGLKISAEDRHNPYPNYARTDYEEILAIQ